MDEGRVGLVVLKMQVCIMAEEGGEDTCCGEGDGGGERVGLMWVEYKTSCGDVRVGGMGWSSAVCVGVRTCVCV